MRFPQYSDPMKDCIKLKMHDQNLGAIHRKPIKKSIIANQSINLYNITSSYNPHKIKSV